MSAISRRTDEQLLMAPADPANESFGSFYARWEEPVLAYFVRRVRAADLAADLTSETFAQALKSRSRFRPERGSAAGWLFGIAQHVLAQSLRTGQVESRARAQMRVTPILLDDETVALIDALSAEQTVQAALSTLPGDQRDAISARILEEQPYADIAERLACSSAVVRQRVSRGLSSLRSQIGDTA